MLQSNTSLTFVVRRRAPELIAPIAPTPRELKPLSDIDDQEGLRYHVPGIHFYHRDPKMGNRNPASVIREALAKVLVFYYPFAGRLKEGSARKLMVDCTGEGVLFIEAEAEVTLNEFGEPLHPTFPCLEELIYDVPGSGGIIDSPLLLIQVTHLLCGGFIVASRLNHTMSDAHGFRQFMTALGEMARGAQVPSILPVWQRELLFARDPPHVTFAHREYEEGTNNITTTGMDEMTEKSFFFGPTEVASIRRLVPQNLKSCSTFEVLAACLWRCRTIALKPNLEEEMRFMFPFDARAKFNPPLPIGYYGNCIVLTSAISTARDLAQKPLSHALELVTNAKSIVTEKYVKSTTDLMVIKGRPNFNHARSYCISNLTKFGFDETDFGWGKAAYGGPATGGLNIIPGVVSYCMRSKKHKGESGIMVPICLSSRAMDKFIEELNNMLILDNE
ncbi:hypothetical protein L6452_29362 [Arctium lappa]|uniref:Uncharacterized protein n=1 Tax=Arctium lappa TaxID=4217 RepID=A0ACB8ZGR4_ARCLA|nr:hypothetical protein L6452_29362 [Arctium lappa]